MKSWLLLVGLSINGHTDNRNAVACPAAFLNFLNAETISSVQDSTNIDSIIEAYRRMILAVQRLSPDQLVEMLATRSYFSLPNSQSSLGDILQNGLSSLKDFVLNQSRVTLQDLEPYLHQELQRVVGVGQIEEAKVSENIDQEQVAPPLSMRLASAGTLGVHFLFSSTDNLAAIDRYKFVDVIDRRTGVLFHLGDKTSYVSALKFSPEGKYLLRQGHNWTKVYEAHSGTLVFQSSSQDSVYFRPGYNELIEFKPTEIRFRELPSGKILKKSKTVGGENIQIDPSGQYAIFYDPRQSSILLWDLKAWKLHNKTPIHSNVMPYGFSATAKYFFIVIGSNYSRIGETKSGQLVIPHLNSGNIIFSPGDTYFATSSPRLNIKDQPGVISVRDPISDTTILTASHSSMGHPLLSFSHDERYLFVGSSHNQETSLFHMYDLFSKARLIQLRTPDLFEHARLSPNKRNVILFFKGGRYLVYSLVEEKEIYSARIASKIEKSREGSWTLSADGEFAGFQARHNSAPTCILNMKRLWKELGD